MGDAPPDWNCGLSQLVHSGPILALPPACRACLICDSGTQFALGHWEEAISVKPSFGAVPVWYVTSTWQQASTTNTLAFVFLLANRTRQVGAVPLRPGGWCPLRHRASNF